MYKNAHADLEILIQSVLSSFAFTLENAALEEYQSETSYIPPETTRLVSTSFFFVFCLEFRNFPSFLSDILFSIYLFFKVYGVVRKKK